MNNKPDFDKYKILRCYYLTKQKMAYPNPTREASKMPPLSAQQAREISEDAIKDIIERRMEDITTKIKETAIHGNRCIRLLYVLETDVIRALKELGYEISIIRSDDNLNNENITTISW